MGTFTRVGRELHYNGTRANLAGVHAGVGNLSTTDSLDPPFDDDMQRLVQYKNNFFRHWLIPYWKYSPRDKVLQRNCVFNLVGSKWDLTSYNVDYIRRLLQMIDKAAQKGIAVQLTIFERSGLDNTLFNNEEYTKYRIRRWEDSPWNAANNLNGVISTGNPPGLPEFFQYQRRLREIQQAWLQLIVDQTKGYWNVFYEIMNEPLGGTTDERVRWADWVVGIIHNRTRGSRLIFYNDMHGGTDVNRWKQLSTVSPTANPPGLPYYPSFHGVIFHGNPTLINPDTGPYDFKQEKIFQVSSDTYPQGRDDYAPNKMWTQHAFDNKMMFQAHTNSSEAARGIGDANPAPTRLV
ncbi:MAG: hypothetical protein ICV60_09385 [Pyrinomonadaceae bacterium]|nr:hypothetical protein [Pyrinomonadaceae bacterium]